MILVSKKTLNIIRVRIRKTMGTFEVELFEFCLIIRLSVYEGQILKYCVLCESSLKVPYI